MCITETISQQFSLGEFTSQRRFRHWRLELGPLFIYHVRAFLRNIIFASSVIQSAAALQSSLPPTAVKKKYSSFCRLRVCTSFYGYEQVLSEGSHTKHFLRKRVLFCCAVGISHFAEQSSGCLGNVLLSQRFPESISEIFLFLFLPHLVVMILLFSGN